MTVLSRPYKSVLHLFPLFGRPQAGVLECLNCPMVKDVLRSTDVVTGAQGMKTRGTT
jgi:hypothetical protein